MSTINTTESGQETVFPGENWFFYWKTSKSLWREKLLNFNRSKIIVPINWAFHCETNNSFDFTSDKPETDLKDLEVMAHELGKEIIFLLPITPAPFLANGGLPHFLSLVKSCSDEGMLISALDNKLILNKIYSFYDLQVYKGFRNFVKALGKYFSKKEISSNLWGLNSGYIKDSEFYSYITDTSKACLSAFQRFLTVKQKERKENGNDTPFINSVYEEKKLMYQFQKSILELYEETIREFIDINFEGIIKVAYLGGGVEDILLRSIMAESIRKYSLNILDCLGHGITPSSVLLPFSAKKGMLEKQMNDLVDDEYQRSLFDHSHNDSDGDKYFVPLIHFEFFKSNPGNLLNKDQWQENGLMNFLDKHYMWVYKKNEICSKYSLEDLRSIADKIFFFQGNDLDSDILKMIIKIFMKGGKIIINSHKINEKYQKKLDTFFLENALEIENMNKIVDITYCQLGVGSVLIFDGANLKIQTPDDQYLFWKELLETYQVLHVEILKDQGIDNAWRTRGVRYNELSYEEIRRVYLYNSTSYKKKAVLEWGKSFALTKIINEQNVKIINKPNNIAIDFLPMGAVTIEFGVFPCE